MHFLFAFSKKRFYLKTRRNLTPVRDPSILLFETGDPSMLLLNKGELGMDVLKRGQIRCPLQFG